jgi:DNA-3-methyladenine glycosylase II
MKTLKTQTAHNHLLTNSQCTLPKLSVLMNINGPIDMPAMQDKNLYRFLAKSVVGQQLSKNAAMTIFSRIENKASDMKISLPTFLSGSFSTEVKLCGVSKSKIKALQDVTKTFNEKVDFEKELSSLSHEETVHEMTMIWGVGRWTADMVSLFYFNHEDVWSFNDTSLNKGLSILCEEKDLSQTQCEMILSPFKPYRSYVALHIWKGIDEKAL